MIGAQPWSMIGAQSTVYSSLITQYSQNMPQIYLELDQDKVTEDTLNDFMMNFLCKV